jgi:predicted TIM-barrel fold metal-dependent hydrolase
MAAPLVHGIPVIDVDSHYTEPRDLWTSRAPARFKDRVPHVEMGSRGHEHWVVDDGIDFGPLGYTVVRKDGSKALGRISLSSYEEMSDAATDPKARLVMMDQLGLTQQLLYPNVGGFSSYRFLEIGDTALRNVIASIYNDAAAELQGEGAGRLFPQAVVPFWDVDAAVKELYRIRDLGLTGITMCDTPELLGLPYLHEPHWDRFWATCEELALPVNFHIGAGGDIAEQMLWSGYSSQRRIAALSVTMFIVQFRTVLNLILSGLLERFPTLNFVVVESGIGWIPFVLEAMEWQFDESMPDDRAGLSLRPTEYFRRQIYSSFWFEEFGPRTSIERIGEDNVMFEVDFPHPTCLYPMAKEHATRVLSDVDARVRRKVLHDTAARLYQLPDPDPE